MYDIRKNEKREYKKVTMIGITEIGIVFIVAALLAFIAKSTKQPMIPAYILAGLVLGPLSGFVKDTASLAMISEIGIAFLLFIIGLEINLEKIREVGKYVIIGSILQVALTLLITYFVSLWLGFDSITSLYLGFIVAFSSTMVVVKLLSDYAEIETIHARLIIGILLMQDLIAVFALSSLGSLSDFSIINLAWALAKGLFVIIIALLIGKYVIPPLFKFAAKSQELLFVAAVSVCFFFAIIFMTMQPVILFIEKIFNTQLPGVIIDLFKPGLPFSIGAFFAGVMLGSLPYNFGIISKVKSVKDFFSIIFYVSLGMQLAVANILSLFKPMLILLLLVILVKPIIILLICSLFGFKKRTSIFTALYMAQVSEFSLIMAFTGINLGHISSDTLTIVVMLTLISIAITSYVFNYNEKIYRKLRFLGFLEKLSKENREPEHYKKMKYDVVLCGHNRIGYSVLKASAKLGKNILVVDYNPDVIRKMMRQNIPCIYGDISDEELLDEIKVVDAKYIVSTVPDVTANMLLIKKAKADNEGVVFVTANQVEDALKLYEAGADYVIMPHFLGGEHASLLLEHVICDFSKLDKIKKSHIEELYHRKGLGHEHPE